MVVGFGDVQFRKNGGTSDVIRKRPQRRQWEGVKDGPEVDQAEVATRPVLPVGFKLQMQRGAPGGWLTEVDRFHYLEVDQLLEGFFAEYGFFGAGLERPELGAGGDGIASIDVVDYFRFFVLELRN